VGGEARGGVRGGGEIVLEMLICVDIASNLKPAVPRRAERGGGRGGRGGAGEEEGRGGAAVPGAGGAWSNVRAVRGGLADTGTGGDRGDGGGRERGVVSRGARGGAGAQEESVRGAGVRGLRRRSSSERVGSVLGEHQLFVNKK
jgi:hypothetical protein